MLTSICSFLSLLFEDLEVLKYLSISNNLFTVLDFPKTFQKLSSLHHFDISNNEITTTYGNLPFIRLRSLNLANNLITRFFIYEFANISRNLVVNLTGNHIESVDFRVPESVSHDHVAYNLSIELGSEGITCNCHTINLFKFMMNYSSNIWNVKINPQEISCIPEAANGNVQYLKDIKPVLNSVLCPLDIPTEKRCPKFCACNRRPIDSALIIECMNVNKFPVLPNYKDLHDIKTDHIELNLNYNVIRELPNRKDMKNFDDVTNLKIFGNTIKQLTTENLPANLRVLDIRFNLLQYVDDDVVERFRQLESIMLGDNQWDCKRSENLIRFVQDNRTIVRDFKDIQCSDGRFFLEINLNSCAYTLKMLMAILMLLSLTAAMIWMIYIIKTQRWNLWLNWLYEHNSHYFVEYLMNLWRVHDACIITSTYDCVFSKYIVGKLMSKPINFKCCMFMIEGDEDLEMNVLSAIRSSRRVIVVLSEHFHIDDWNRFNYGNIHTQVIMIVKRSKFLETQDINLRNMKSIRWGDPWFWDQLRHLMVKFELFDVPDRTVGHEMQLLNCVEII